MEEVFMGIMVMLPLVVIFLLYVRKRREISPSPQEEQDQVRQRETVIRHSNARRMRRRPTAGSTSSSASTRLEVNDAESDDEIPMGDNDPAQSSKKKGKKRLEREAQRQAEEAARESRQIKQDRYAEMRRRKDEERGSGTLMEEEAKARQIMEEEAAAVEFEKWKGDFSVDAEGTNEDEVKESQGMLSDFVDYIKKHKCVPLEDLATEFQLRTQDCINRITSLEKMGRLSGVMDDRGKYIYISLEEMKAVADYIKRQGRVSISHLASKSNQFIDLEPKTEPLLEGSTLDMVDVA